MKPIHIFGGGPAGLFAAYFAQKKGISCKVYEASPHIGGNCRTFVEGDFRFDSGAHRFHDKDPEMTAEMLSLMGDEVEEIYAPSYIFHNGKLIHFPITPTNMLSRLPLGTLFRAVFHLIFDRYKIPEIHDFQDYTYRKYGKVIADLFLTNYSEKLWGLPTRQLSTQIAGSRLKELNLKAILTEILYPNRKAKHLEGSFFYPKPGFGRIADRVGEYLGSDSLFLNSRITRIFHANDRITGFEVNGTDRVEASTVVSSLPLSIFLRSMEPAPPEDIMAIARSIQFRHLRLVAIFLDKECVNDAATLYFPDRQFIFNRVYEPRNRSRAMSPKGKTSLVVEVPYSFGDQVEKMSDDDLMARVRTQLAGAGFFREQEVLGTAIRSLPFAYPILEKGFEHKIAQINAYLDRFENLYHSGRNGKFVYSWTHNMMQYGKEIVQKIRKNVPEYDKITV